MVSLGSLKISSLFFATVLIFFTAGLLSIAPRTRQSLGAYRIPSETGLLIPSEKRGGLGMRESSKSQSPVRRLGRRRRDAAVVRNRLTCTSICSSFWSEGFPHCFS